jgi:hypothetical protein
MEKKLFSETFQLRSSRFIERLEQQIELYRKVFEAYGDTTLSIVPLEGTEFHNKAIELFGPCLPQDAAKVDLDSVYRAAFHPNSGSLVLATRGNSFLAQAPFSKKYFIVCNIAAAVYQPLSGLESVNIGLSGDIYSGEVILRSESACPPSFLFGSQRCNCSYQWMSVRELCAHLNSIQPPKIDGTEAFERWVEQQFHIQGNRCVPKSPGGPGVLMIHLDSQAGMGSGWSMEEFCHDQYSRAQLRQLGENRVEQLHHTGIKESYQSLGLPPDGRKEGEGSGYQLTAILLDFLEVSKNLICLSNNQQKLHFLAERGYACRRVKSLGQVVHAGLREAKQRGEDYAHQDIGQELVVFEEELVRLKEEVSVVS